MNNLYLRNTPDRQTPICSNKFMSKSWWEKFWQREPERFGPPSARFWDAISKHITQTDNTRAVDIGSGNGRYAILLSKTGYKTDAIEWTQSGINEINNVSKKQEVDINVIQADFSHMEITQSQYNLVLSSGLLEEMPSEQQYNSVISHVNLAKNSGVIALKYCLEIKGRGQLVDADLVHKAMNEAKTTILEYFEDSELKLSKSGMTIRTATLIARKHK